MSKPTRDIHVGIASGLAQDIRELVKRLGGSQPTVRRQSDEVSVEWKDDQGHYCKIGFKLGAWNGRGGVSIFYSKWSRNPLEEKGCIERILALIEQTHKEFKP